MQRWTGSANKRTKVRISFCDPGFGVITLAEVDAAGHLARNPSQNEPLEYELPARSSLAKLVITAVATSGDLPVCIALSQDGVTLPADSNGTPINGNGPYGSVKFAGNAKFNKPRRLRFDVRSQ